MFINPLTASVKYSQHKFNIFLTYTFINSVQITEEYCLKNAVNFMIYFKLIIYHILTLKTFTKHNPFLIISI